MATPIAGFQSHRIDLFYRFWPGREELLTRQVSPLPHRVAPMKTLLVMLTVAALTGCGVEAVGSAATAASIKKQELEQGQKTMQQSQQKIDAAVQQMQTRAGSAD